MSKRLHCLTRRKIVPCELCCHTPSPEISCSTHRQPLQQEARLPTDVRFAPAPNRCSLLALCHAGLHSLSAELPLAPPPPQPAPVGPASIAFGDLEQLRVIGTGQFGLVRLVRHRSTGEPFALKASECSHLR